MADLEGMLKAINTKLHLMQFTHEDTSKTLDKGNVNCIERQRKTLESKVEEVHDLKLKIQESKFQLGEKAKKTAVFETANLDLEKAAKTIKQTELKEMTIQEERMAVEFRQKQFETEINYDKAKLEQKLSYERKEEESRPGLARDKSQIQSNTKLPKLVITKFNGSHTDWIRFWNQFEVEIDKANVAQVTKFPYLKELVEPKVRIAIEGLLFTTEGYERAKIILETKYGKISEVTNAHIKHIMSLRTTQGTAKAKIHDFYDILVTHVQALETLGKLREINGYVRLTLDKLPGVRADLVRLDDEWQEWGFPQLVESLRRWCERNLIPLDDPTVKPAEHTVSERSHSKSQKREKVFQTNQENWKPRPCVYCESSENRYVNCDQVKGVSERRKMLSEKRLCFNCTGSKHRAAECRSKGNCQKCNGKHHSSICDKAALSGMLLAKVDSTVVYPVVVVKVEGITCRALLDTGAGSSYASAQFLDRIGKKPFKREYKQIDMMMSTTTKKIAIYQVEVQNLEGDFRLPTSVNRVERETLLQIPNPQYQEIIKKYNHLQGVEMEDKDEKDELPIHLIQGSGEYSKVKTHTKPRIGKPGESIAELTSYGWTLMSPGSETDLSNLRFARTSSEYYDKLCRLDVLGLEDKPVGDQQTVKNSKINSFVVGKGGHGMKQAYCGRRRIPTCLTTNKEA